ncbi:MAG TPA: CoA transferase [Caulobacteraceae bacterium]|nr:CoA transferase [Caulobacteraceae bacterium]
MTGPVSGMRVLDLSNDMVGAVCTMLLADYGAEVVVVEPTAGCLVRRSGGGITWQRGKRSLVADLGDHDEVALLRCLAESADVVIAGPAPLPPGADRLGYDSLAAANPAVVYCKLSAYGPREPDDGRNTHDFLAAARLGVMSQMSGHRDGPIAPGSPALAYSTALMATVGILAAVRARLLTGEGDLVETSHEDGFLAQRTMAWKSERGQAFIVAKSRAGDLDTGRLRLLLRMFECADGKRVQIHTGGVGAFGRAVEVLGIAGRISRAAGRHEMATPLTDEDLAVMSEIPAILRTRTAEEWCRRFWESEVACLPVLAPGVAFNDPQVRHAGLMRTIRDPELGEIEVVGPPAIFARTPGAIRGPAPRLGEDGDALRRQGWASPGLGAGREQRPLEHPLDGVRVIECSSYFASPYGSRLLASLGADVIKVEPVSGDVFRSMTDPFEGANWGKRGVALDLKAPECRPIIASLVASADVVQTNMRPGAAERLGIDYEAVRKANPSVIYHFAPGYGSTGPKSNLQAFAPLMSGFTGQLTLFGGPGNPPHMGFGNEDYFSGEFAAVSILLALLHRERSGEGQYVEAPLLHSSLLVTSEWFLKDGAPQTRLAQLDRQQTGFGPCHRVYQALDGWLAVACTEETERRVLVATVLGQRPAPDQPEALAEALCDEFFLQPVADWVDRLRAAMVPCVKIFEGDYYADYLGEEALLRSGRVFEFEHRTAGKVRGPDLMFRARRFKGVPGHPAPALGADSREVLASLGFADKTNDLIRRGLVIGPADEARRDPHGEAAR